VYSFKGQYEHSIDEKGRISFPAKLRKLVDPSAQDRFVVVRGIEGCLYLYPENEWLNVEAALSQANNFTRAGRVAKRNFLRYAEDLTLDRQNRLALPADHCTYAGISNKAIFIGVGEYIEVWSPEKLQEADDNLDAGSFEEIFEQVMGGGSATDAD
jgi:MraZ protein